MKRPKTLGGLLKAVARQAPERGLVYLTPEGAELEQSYPALLQQAGRLRAGLTAQGWLPGQPVPLVVGRGRDFYPLFWACQLAGLVPVPIAGLRTATDSDGGRRVRAIWQTLQCPRVVCGQAELPVLERLLGRGVACAWEPLQQAEPDLSLQRVRGQDLALIQFSSGSTSQPKGVCLSHGQLLANLDQMRRRIPLSADDVEVGWMPHFHDMGLIGCHLQFVALGARQVRMEPYHFVKDPGAWLDLVTRHAGTWLTATNTSLRILLKRIPRLEPGRWQLDSVHSLMVGAEPLFPEVLAACSRLLAGAGLRGSALRPCYGLAEASVALSLAGPEPAPRVHRLQREALVRDGQARPAAQDAEGAVELLDVGPPLDGCGVRVVDAQDRALPERRVGHLQIRGPNLTRGYYQNPRATAAAQCGAWWRTGDIGFVHERRLVICGRSKELLLVAGRKFFASDVEAVALEEPGVRLAVACSLARQGQDCEHSLLFVVLQESDWRQAIDVLAAVRRRVQRIMGLPIERLLPVSHQQIPRTTSGKIRRTQLASLFDGGHFDRLADEVAQALVAGKSPAGGEERGPLRALIAEVWAEVLGCQVSAVDTTAPFMEQGGTSVAALEILARLEAALNRRLDYELLVRCASVEDMARALEARPEVPLASPALPDSAQGLAEPMAIIGMACRFPGGTQPEAFWQTLLAGHGAVTDIPAERWPARMLDGVRCQRGGFVADVYHFDPEFFGIPEQAARVLDPQGRLLLELACELLERSGHGGARADRRVGVFLGSNQLPYQELITSPFQRRELFAQLRASGPFEQLPDDARAALERVVENIVGPDPTLPSTLVGNLLNMLAARISHELDYSGPAIGLDTACSTSLLSLHLAAASIRRGECSLAMAGGVNLNLRPTVYRLFDAAGALSARGRCQPFSAEADGFVPGEGAGLVLLKPLSRALADGDRILAVLRGSAINNDGRSLGPMAPHPRGQAEVLAAAYRNAGLDPGRVSLIEAHGTGTVVGDSVELRALRDFFVDGKPRFLGSVKSHIGHTLGAAGVAGLIKVLLCLQHRRLPASLLDATLNPRLRLAEQGWRLPARDCAWEDAAPRCAGLSSFGFGGTNCHVVVEEAPHPGTPEDVGEPPLRLPLLLSAPTAAHLRGYAATLAENLSPSSAAVCHELAWGRRVHAERAARICAPSDTLATALTRLGHGEEAGWLRGSVRRPPRVALVFPGQGSQFPHQAAGLLAAWPAMAARMTELCAGIQLERPLLEFCYGPDADAESLQRTDVAQPLLVAFQIALAEQLLRLGLEPVAVLGHSVGELSAACLAGALDPRQAVLWTARRGQLMQELPTAGGMAAVLAPASALESLLQPWQGQLAIAAYNGPGQTVISGDRAALKQLSRQLEQSGRRVLPLAVSHAFHSPLMATAAERLESCLEELRAGPLRRPLLSTVLGRQARAEELDARYWSQHVLQPVRFEQACAALSEWKPDVVLEVGPGAGLTGLLGRLLPEASALALCRPPAGIDHGADLERALDALARLWVRGAPLDLQELCGPAPAHRPRLPGIPWRRRRLCIEDPCLGSDSGRLLHSPEWVPRAPVEASAPGEGCWLLLGAAKGWAAELAQCLREAGRRVVCVAAGPHFARYAEDAFGLRADSPEQLRWLLQSLAGERVAGVVHLWTLEPESQLDQGVLSVLAWLQAVLSGAARPRLWVIAGDAWGAAAAGLAEALFDEHPDLAGRCLLLDGVVEAQAVVAELGRRGPLLRLSGGQRLTRRFVPWAAPPRAQVVPGLSLILGGSSGVGAALAARLAASPGARLVLSGRRPEASLSPLLGQLRAQGAQVRYEACDLLEAGALKALLARVEAREGVPDLVVLAAGQARFGALRQRELDTARQILATKLLPAQQLARWSEAHVKARVMLLSSIAGCLPGLGKGLGDYAAANAGLDAVASEQRAAGLPWTSAAFSLWRDTGMGVRMRVGEVRDRKGLRGLSSEDGLAGFEAALAGQAAHLLVAEPEDLQKASLREERAVASEAPALALPARPPVKRQAAAPEISPAVPAPPVSTAVLQPSAQDLEELLRGLLAEALELPRAAIDLHTPFQTLGLDSLVALELVKRLEQATGQTLSLTLFFEHDSLARLLAFLAALQPSARRELPAGEDLARLPLLPAQQTFYANQRFFPELSCTVSLRLQLRGALRPALLEQALGFLTQRHAMLRVGFFWHDGALVQRAIQPAPLRVAVHKLPAAGDKRLAELDLEQRNRIFDLERGPLLDLAVCQLPAPDSHCLMFAIHHIVADAWSAYLLVWELLELHARLLTGRPLQLPELPTSFASVVQALQSDAAADASRTFWQQLLRDPAPPLRLPFDGDPEAEPRGPANIHTAVLADEATRWLHARAREWQVSSFELVMLSYLLCLQRWSGQSDLLVRMASARREARLPGIERIVGCFADSLPVRVRLAAEPAREQARALRRLLIEVQKHPYTSSLELAGLHDRKHAGPRGLTPAGISFPSFKGPDRVGELEITDVSGGAASGFTQLGLIAWEFGGRLCCSWNTLAGLFLPQTVERLAGEHLEQLRALVQPSGEVEPMPAELPGLPPGQTLSARLAASLARHGGRPAVLWQGATTRYDQLETAQARLAAALRDHGARPGERVGVLLRPGLQAVVGLLGCLASGAAYVPLDPDYPDARIREIADHAGIRVLLSCSEHLGRLQHFAAVERVLLLDDPLEDDPVPPSCLAWSALPVALPEACPAGPDDIAYVMYTSGTTGRPKGVMVSHRAVCLFHDWVHEAFAITADDRFIQTSALSFGGSIRQVFSPLLAGAQLLPAPRGLTRDPFALVDFLESHAITIWNSVPTLWRRLMDSLDLLRKSDRQPRLQALRWILIGGENVPAALVRRWFDQGAARPQIANLYGSTETVVNASWFALSGRPPQSWSSVPIGRARAGSELLLLDERGQPSVVGEVGELFVGGPSLADGYLADPERSEQAFVSLPGRDGRWYRTGDLVRRDHEGLLRFVGRRDSQVKIRGNRVELGEIEGVLCQQPGVRAAAVIELRDPQRQWLLGYVEGRELDEVTLKAALARRLPGYMVPHRIELRARLPLTSAGKLDRRALRETRQAAARETASESLLRTIWRQVLGLEKIGLDDDFFALGGDSILALDVLQRLQGQVPVLPRPLTLYGERSIRRLAAHLDGLAQAGPQPEPMTTSAGDFPLGAAQAGWVLAQRQNPARSPSWCAQIPIAGALRAEIFQKALAQLVHRHPGLRTVFVQQGLQTRQRVLAEMPLRLPCQDLRALPSERQQAVLETIFAQEQARVFALETGPLFSMQLVQLADERWRWFLSVHHAVADAWSILVLGAELLPLYDAQCDGLPSPLAPLRASYREVVHCLQNLQDVPGETAWWAERFAAPWPDARLGTVAGARAHSRALKLAPALLERLRGVARSKASSLHLLVLTVWLRWLRRQTGESDRVLGCATSGRDLPVADVAHIFGCFVSGLPLRVQVGGDDFDSDLAAISQAFADACAHASLPVHQLLKAIPRHPSSPYPPGARFFFSLLDFSRLPAPSSARLQIDADAVESRFQSGVEGAELSLNVWAGSGLRLSVHGLHPPAFLRELLQELQAELSELAGPVLDAALVCYLPAPSALQTALGATGELRASLRARCFPDGQPRLFESLQTPLGCSGAVFIPRFADELAAPGLLEELEAAVELAYRDGARSISLAGMLPARCGYGRELERSLDAARGACLTTGHAATAATVLLTVAALLARFELALAELHLAVVGFGSIGKSSLGLLLETLGTPARLSICDRPGVLQRNAEGLAEAFSGPLQLVASTGNLPEQAYQADLIVGASSAANILEVAKLRPGTLVADDSFPALFDAQAAWRRMRGAADVLLTGAGRLQIAPCESRPLLAELPRSLWERAQAEYAASGLPGCRAESLLRSARPELPRVRGLVEPACARSYLAAIRELGIASAPPHLGGQCIEAALLERIGQRLARARGRR